MNIPVNLLRHLETSEEIENKADWPVYSALSGPICARVPKLHILAELDASGHHDWPDNVRYRFRAPSQSRCQNRTLSEYAGDPSKA